MLHIKSNSLNLIKIPSSVLDHSIGAGGEGVVTLMVTVSRNETDRFNGGKIIADS